MQTVAPAAQAPKPARRPEKAGAARAGVGKPVSWLFALPAILLVLAIHLAPSVAGGWYAFTDWDGLTADASWVGLDNFKAIFDDPATADALTHTLLLAGAFLVLTNTIGLALALGLNRTLKSRHLLRAVFFLPAVVSPIAVAYVWRYIFEVDGALNWLLTTVGREEWTRAWLADPSTALWTILVVMVWQFSGLAMIIFLAGLQSISPELDEAAAVDGASPWMRFRRITLPLLAPAITITATLMLIFGLRVFDQVIALTNGGPVAASETLATQVYKQAFELGQFGYSTAMALMLALLLAVVSLTQLVVLRKREARL